MHRPSFMIVPGPDVELFILYLPLYRIPARSDQTVLNGEDRTG
jgi:hypothetical protein